MLDAIRRNQQSWLTYLIFIAIIVVFVVNFGPGSSGCRGMAGTPQAAKVDGDPIRQQEFAMTLNRRMDSMRKNASASNFDFTPEMAERMGLRQQVIDELINKKLLAHEAARRGLAISDQELLDYLHKSYGLKDVSEDDYRTIVERNFQTSVGRFEQDLRDELRVQKLSQMLTDNVSVSEGELKASFMREHDRAMVEYVKFDPAVLGRSDPANIDVDNLIAKEGPALEERYNQDTFKYRNPEQRKVSQIVLHLAANASDAEVAKTRGTLLEIKGQIEGGADFAAIAKARSEDEATKAKGGDFGWFQRGQMMKAIDEQVFSLKAGELSPEPVRLPGALALIRVDEIRPPGQRPLDEVRRDVAVSILRDRSGEAEAKKQAEAFLVVLKSGKSLDKVTVSEEDEKAAATGDKASSDKSGKSAQKDKKPAVVKPTGAIVRYETPWIEKNQEFLPRIGASKELHGVIFALTKEHPLATSVYKVGRSYFVVLLKDREVPDVAKFEAEKDSLKQQALWDKKNRVLQDWLKQLRADAKVELNPDILSTTKDRKAKPPEDEG